MRLAFKNLFQDKTRFLLSVMGVALAILLMLVLKGFVSGMYQQINAYLLHSPASVVITQTGVTNLLGAISILPREARAAVEDNQAVERAIPILSQFVILDLHEKKQPAYLIGYQQGSGGGPWALASGREPVNNDEIVVDRVLAEKHSLEIEDRLDLMGKSFKIVGLSTGTISWMTSFIFIPKTAAELLVGVPGASSFLLVTTKLGWNLDSVIDGLKGISGVEVLPKTVVAANDLKLFAQVFSAPLKMMVAIAFVVGALVIGLILYTSTVERTQEYGVLKAIGAGNALLYKIVTIQAITASVIGSLLGIGLGIGLGQAIMAIRPQFLILIRAGDILFALAAGLGMAIFAGLFPIRVITGLSPAEVFRR